MNCFIPRKLRRERDERTNSTNTTSQHSGGAAEDEFATRQARRDYDAIYDKTVTAAGRAFSSEFPSRPLSDIPDPIHIDDEKWNHCTMKYGYVQHNFRQGVQKGETASGYGDDFCQVHGITRVFVVDKESHLIAMCTPYRYMMYMANRMYSKNKFDGNIFQFGGNVVATPRWAMRASAWHILKGQGGQILKTGDSISISASHMDDHGVAYSPSVVFHDIPFSGMSWVVMDKWLEDARSHKISLVVGDTGLGSVVEFDRAKTFPLVIREDESDMLMGDPVRNLVVQDQRFQPLIEKNLITPDTVALQFRAGWYAPYNPCGATRIMRILKHSTKEDKAAVEAQDSSGFWVPEKAYSKDFVRPPGRDLWVIGGLEDMQHGALAKEIGTHYDMPVNLEPDSGGFN